MPLDIGEIGVRVNVRDPQEPAAAGDPAAAAGCAASAAALSASQQRELVDQCVRLVLQALRSQGAR